MAAGNKKRFSAGASLVDQPDFSVSPARHSRRSERLLLLLFFFSVPFLNPWVRGDGVGYYAFARAPLIEHSLDFTKDYQYANESFRAPRLDENNQPKSGFRTPTGRLDNHFTVGPAILWTPFLLLAHPAVLLPPALPSSAAPHPFSAAHPPQCAPAFRPPAPPGNSSQMLPLPEPLLRHFLFAATLLASLLPTFISLYLVYGSPFESAYIPLRDWLWSSPVFFSVLFSSNHGLFSWTPILLLALAGLFLFWRREPRVCAPLLAAFFAFYIFISCYPDWAR